MVGGVGGGGGLGRGVVATPPPFLVGLSIVVEDWDPDVWLLPPSSNELSEKRRQKVAFARMLAIK